MDKGEKTMYTCLRCGSVLPSSAECLCPPGHIQEAAETLERKAQEAAERACMKEPMEIDGTIYPVQAEIYLTIAKALRGQE